MSPCPHCRALAPPEPSRFFGRRCRVCGGPWIDAGGDEAVVARALPHLVRAQRARAMAIGWTAAAAVFAGIATMALALSVVAGAASRGLGLLFVGVAAGSAAIVLAGARRASRHNAGARAELVAAGERSAVEAEARPQQDAA